MNKTILYVILFVSVKVSIGQISLEQLRKNYYRVNSDSVACAKLFQKIIGASATDNLIKGYKGAITAAMANYVSVREQKLKLFKQGKEILEESLKNDSNNIELRFLRLTIQYNCPRILGYHNQAEGDKQFVLSRLNQIKPFELKESIKAYFLQSKDLSEVEKQRIKSESN